jgi:cytochrome c biogenesis protein CcdA
MALGSLAFALFAGTLSVLSPCVLPILPVVFGTAAAQHRLAPAALGSGIILSFSGVGLFIATAGFSMGLDGSVFRYLGAALLLGFGAILLSGPLQDRFSLAAGRFCAVIAPVSASLGGEGVAGQFLLGLSLGLVWSPCVGPTLGAASVMAAQGDGLPQVGATMALFAIGATLPLLALGRLSTRISANSRRSLLALGHRAKIAVGAVAAVTGLLILTGFDRPLESLLVAVSPPWLTRLTTSF